MTAPAPILVARDVVKKFGEATAVAGVSFEVRPGECYGLLGPNGAGKTTLFKLVTHYARRDGGTLTVFGLDPARSPSEVKARLGVVSQQDNLSLFSGMVFPVTDLPHGVRELAFVLPMFHVTELNRLLLFGPARCAPFVWVCAPYLLVLTVVTTWWAIRAIERRIVQ